MKHIFRRSKLSFALLLGIGLLLAQAFSVSPAAAATVQKYYGPNWGGNGAYGARGTYRSVSATFTVPSVSPPYYNGSGTVSFWVGLGGVEGAAGSSQGLIQAGVLISVSQSGNTITQTNQAFWEYETQSSTYGPHMFNLTVHTHDTISLLVESNLNNSGTNFSYIDDSSTGTRSVNWSGFFSDSATGECIAERNPGSLLAPFGTEGFRSCWVGTNSTGNYVNNWNHYDFVPTTNGTSSGAPLMTINALDSTGDFSVTWLRSS